MRDVFDGAIVAFECLGNVPVAEHKFLDAITEQGRAKLSPNFEPPFTGARWQCMSQGGEGFALVSAGATFGFRYLDGRTQDGFVQTVGDTLPPFSGTRWRIQELSPGVVTIQSLGDFINPVHQFLDGRTGDGSVGLAPFPDQPFSGTKWGTIGLPRPSLQVQTQRQAITSRLTMRGTNFTPNDTIRFVAEGIVGREHAPFPLSLFANADGSGSFEAFDETGFFPHHPADVQVIVRATDQHGRTANGVSNGFHP
jgi:hypothetical protein